MHHSHARHEVHSPTYNKWSDTKVPYSSPTMEANDVTMDVLESLCEDPKYLFLSLIWELLYDLECYEKLKHVVTSPMSLENIA